MKITTQKISEIDALKLYDDLIRPDTAALKTSKSKSKGKRNDILNVLSNLESVFAGFYLHHRNVPKEIMFKKNIEERIKLRNGRSDEIVKKEKKISSELLEKYFVYLSPSDIDKALNETKSSEENKAQVKTIKNRLTNW